MSDEFYDILKKVEGTIEQIDVDIVHIKQALKIVEKYIQDNNLVLYGGQALHYALMIKDGVGIYTKNNLPDYDFLVAHPWQDSIDLADLIVKQGIENISCINAMHLTTRRVRYNFQTVADLSYYPKNILKIIPKIKYDKFYLVHPNWQRLDFHRELIYLFENAPFETVKHRTNKTIARFAKINKNYPIKPNKKIMQTTIDLWKKNKVKKLNFLELFPEKTFQDNCISGMHAYACYYAIIKQTLYTQQLKNRERYNYLISRICPMEINWENLEITIPKNLPARFNILSDNFLEIQPRKYKTKKFYRRFLDDIRPRVSQFINNKNKWSLDIYDNKGKYTSASSLENIAKYSEKLDVFFSTEIKTKIASVQVILLDFLVQYFLTKDEIWIYLYTSAEALVVIAEQIYLEIQDENWLKIPFFLGTEYYGSENWSLNQLYNYWKTEMYVKKDNREVMNMRPPNYYPEAGKMEPREWENPKSWIFQWDGKETDELKPLEKNYEDNYSNS